MLGGFEIGQIIYIREVFNSNQDLSGKLVLSITGGCYANVIKQLRVAIKEKKTKGKSRCWCPSFA